MHEARDHVAVGARDLNLCARAQHQEALAIGVRLHLAHLIEVDDGRTVDALELARVEPPLFVFVTAFQEHAIRAFQANALHYLMKPVDEDKLADVIEHVRQRLNEKRGADEAEKLMNVLAEVAPETAEELQEGTAESGERFEKLLNVKDRGKIFRVEVDSIEHIEAAGDYMCIYTGDNSLILRETMKDLERRLDPRKFQRVHRSTIVNLDQVRQVKPHTNGECFLVLGSGAEVKVSRSYRDVVARFVH